MKNHYLQFAMTAGVLKQTVRTGWTNFGIHDPESVAEHSFRVAILAMVLAHEYGADPGKAAQMALVHDLGEATIGDIITERGTQQVSDRAAKVELERKALLSILKKVNQAQLIDLFDEFEARETPEARLVRDLDKLEKAIQASEYEMSDRIDLDEFIVGARHDVQHPKMQEIIEALPRLDSSGIDPTI